jgi:hypothetical protein
MAFLLNSFAKLSRDADVPRPEEFITLAHSPAACLEPKREVRLVPFLTPAVQKLPKLKIDCTQKLSLP